MFKASSTDRHVFTVSSNEQKQGLMVNSHQNGEADMVFQLAGFPVKSKCESIKRFQSYSRWTINWCKVKHKRGTCCRPSFNSN